MYEDETIIERIARECNSARYAQALRGANRMRREAFARQERDRRIQRIYWKALARYERREYMHYQASLIERNPESSPGQALIGTITRNYYRPLVRQALVTASKLEGLVFGEF